MRNILMAIFISIALMGICALGGNLQPDPRHKAEVTIDGIKFSCPKGFTIQTVSGYLTARLIQHDKAMAGVFVILPGKNIVSAQRPLYDHISEIASNNGVKKGQAYE